MARVYQGGVGVTFNPSRVTVYTHSVLPVLFKCWVIFPSVILSLVSSYSSLSPDEYIIVLTV